MKDQRTVRTGICENIRRKHRDGNATFINGMKDDMIKEGILVADVVTEANVVAYLDELERDETWGHLCAILAFVDQYNVVVKVYSERKYQRETYAPTGGGNEDTLQVCHIIYEGDGNVYGHYSSTCPI